MQHYTVAVTSHEVLAAEAVLKNDDREEMMLSCKALLLKLGSAFVSQQDRPDDVMLAFTEAELWLLREKVPMSARVGSDPCGITLKKKVYAGLLEFDAAKKADIAVAREAPDHSRRDAQFEKWADVESKRLRDEYDQ